MTAANGLTTSSTHSFQVDYVKTRWRAFAAFAGRQRFDLERSQLGRHSYEWMAAYYGSDITPMACGRQLR